MHNLKRSNILKKLHLIIGFSTGLVVFIVCLTGCIYTFQKEIRLLTAPYYKVAPLAGHAEKLPLSQQLKSYQSTSNDTKVLRIYDHKASNRSTIFLVTQKGAYSFAFVNPYTGKLLQEKPLAKDFFYIVLYIHMNLLLGTVGSYIVKYSVLLFVISLLTGIILWFPKRIRAFKNKKTRSLKFTIKKESGTFMRRYQLHSVLGIYAAALLMVISLTGLGWAFSWVDELFYTAVSFQKKVVRKPQSIEPATFNPTVLDQQQKKIATEYPQKQLVMYFLPQKPTATLRINAVAAEDKFGHSDSFAVHPQTGDLVESQAYKDKNNGERLRDLYYDLHTGSILGIPGKIIAFLASLIGASLPVTGFLLWRYKRKRKQFFHS